MAIPEHFFAWSYIWLHLENIQAYPPLRVDVRVVYRRQKLNLWRMNRVIARELDVKSEGAVFVRRLAWPFDFYESIVHQSKFQSPRACVICEGEKERYGRAAKLT